MKPLQLLTMRPTDERGARTGTSAAAGLTTRAPGDALRSRLAAFRKARGAPRPPDWGNSLVRRLRNAYRLDYAKMQISFSKRGIVGVGVVLVLLSLLLGNTATFVTVLIIVLATLQGLWRGATELAGLVLGLILAVPLSPAIGRGIEGWIGAIAGTAGITNRLLSMAVVALVVIVTCAVAGRLVAKRVVRKHPEWELWDPYVGAGLGLAEGCLLALMLLWAPLLLEPVARLTVEDREAANVLGLDPEPPNPISIRVIQYAEQVRRSALSGVAEKTNPFGGSLLLSLAVDFVSISRDTDALESLVHSAVTKKFEALPSVAQARQMIEDDPDVAVLLGEDGLTADGLRSFMNSPTILRIFDQTTVVSDFTPLAGEFVTAIREAKKQVKPVSQPSPQIK